MTNRLTEKSKEVIVSCCLANGAIVAADSDGLRYPSDVQNYRYVWPRDASYICVAAKRAGITSIQEPFFRWLLERAEGVMQDGLIFQNYYVNGPKRWLGLQIDQNGSILWAIHEFYGDDSKFYPEWIMPLVKKLAEGIVSQWKKDHFHNLTQDLWEERYAYPEFKQYHSYSLAACIKGLLCASIIDEGYKKTANEMLVVLKSNDLTRTPGIITDSVADSSLLGLIWPFEIFSSDSKEAEKIIRMIEKKLLKKGGVYRYENDSYDSRKKHGLDARRGAGSWPILNFWLAIIMKKRGQNDEAEKLVEFVTKNMVDDLIPEQIFMNDIQHSVKPLAWSHAMFLLYYFLDNTGQ